MHNASKLGFSSRQPGDGPIFVMNVPLGERLPEPELPHAKSVTLRKGDERVLVRALQHQPGGSFIGEIYGFEPSVDIQFEGLRVGDQIAFDEAHIFGADD